MRATLLLAPSLVSALVLPREDWDSKFNEWKNGKPQELVDAFSNLKGKFVAAEGADNANELGIFDDYEKPNQYIKVILSPGDSYTAGIGSNGPGDHYGDSGDVGSDGCSRFNKAWPEALRDSPRWKDQQGDGWRKNNFGACSGAVIQDIKGKQLELGENEDKDMFKKIGAYPNAPQIAVFTAGGNDMKFASIVKACIYSIPLAGDCNQILEEADHRLNDPTERQKLKDNYHLLYASIIAAGRMALAGGGPAKPSNFQVFHGTYIPFFDENDEVCDDVEWSFLPTWSPNYLKRDFRKRLNKLATDLNDVIRESADEYKQYGVFWVDSYIKEFDEHRFCSPTGRGHDEDVRVHSGKNQDLHNNFWFWGMRSLWRDGDEGADLKDSTTWDGSSPPNVTKATLDHLKIDEAGEQKLLDGTPWDQISPSLKDLGTFETAIKDLEIKDNDGNVYINLNDGYNRVFHPKGTALKAVADGFFDAIVAQRDWTFDKTNNPSSTNPQPSPTPSTEPPAPTTSKSVQVFFAHSYDKNASGKAKKDSYFWHIFAGKSGEGIDPCKNPVINAADDFTIATFTGSDSNPNMLPNGEFKVKVDDQQCTYQGLGEERPGKDVGWLNCDGKASVKCLKDHRFSEDYRVTCDRSGIPQYYHTVAYCDW